MKELDIKDCQNPECGLPFEPKVHNQIYCEPTCRTVVMNARILERYHAKKNARKNKERRICIRKTCNNILSIYNNENICESCKEVRFQNRLAKWGWSQKDIDRYKQS